MKFNQKGFSAVEILVVIVVIGLLGAVGWLVYDRQNNKSSETPDTKPSTSITQNSPADKNEELPASKLKYDKGSYAFLYPDTWAVDNTNQDDSVVLKAADYKKYRPEDVPEGEVFQWKVAGYLLEIREIPNNAPNETIEKLTDHIVVEEKTLGGGSHKQIAVDGNKALLVNNKHEDTYLYVIVFHDGKRTHMQLNSKDDSDSESAKVFDEILASFKFK